MAFLVSFCNNDDGCVHFICCVSVCFDFCFVLLTMQLLMDCSLSHQESIDFNTVNIHRTEGMYFLVFTGNRGDIE